MKTKKKDYRIVFNKPHLSGKESEYILETVKAKKISGDGLFTKKCHAFFEKKYGFHKTLLTTSCTDALEMCALLLRLGQRDEVIMPAFTFVSTANAFVLRGAKIVFCDSGTSTPNINAQKIEELITPRTKAIVVVHYAGIACDMKKIMAIAGKYGLFVIEDAAQAIDSYYNGKPLGSFGNLSAFSFHETKNIISGEGGMLVINDRDFTKRAEIIREKGTNRSAFFRGEVDKYNWVDVGSSFLPSDIISAFLYAQLENLEVIQAKRKKIWKMYYDLLDPLQKSNYIKLPAIPGYATNNGHIFYMLCKNLNERTALIEHLGKNKIQAVFHYMPLHKSPYYRQLYGDKDLKNAEYYADCLLRLPLYYDLEEEEISYISKAIRSFYSR